MAARIAAADVDPFALQDTPVRPRRWTRPRTVFIAVGLIAYILGLIALIPAQAVLDESERLRVGGTVWKGNAVLGSTVQIDWVVSPLASISRLGFSAQFHLTGGGSDLAGQLTQRGEQFQIDAMSGQVSGELLEALFPRLPIRCAFEGDLRVDKLRLGGSGQTLQGNLLTGPVTCFAKDAVGIPIEFAGLTGAVRQTSSNSVGAIATKGTEPLSLVEIRLTPEGNLSIWPTQMAVARAPFLASQRYDTVID